MTDVIIDRHGCHVSDSIACRWVRTEAQRSSRRDDSSVGPAHEQHRVVCGAQGEGAGALGHGRLVCMGGQQIIQPLVAQLLEEPLPYSHIAIHHRWAIELDSSSISSSRYPVRTLGRTVRTLMYTPGKPIAEGGEGGVSVQRID